MTASFQKPPDQQQIIAKLAAESQVPIDDVAALYEHERAGLAAGARITRFLHIFAIRNVQEILRRRTVRQQPAQFGDVSLLRA